MKYIAALLLASSVLTAMTPVYADEQKTTSQNSIFWSDDQNTTREEANPLTADYPSKDSPEGRPATYYENDCEAGSFENHPASVPMTSIWSRPGSKNLPKYDRRGEMTGDDGVVEMIQDSPCALIYRRGGENFATRRHYTHPEDIRRVNVLENRYPPVQPVGRYVANAGRGGNWAVDPDNPYVDSKRSWTAQKGMMLSELLTYWGEEAGYEVVWKSPHDFVIRADLIITGSFPEVAGEVIASFQNANPPISGEFYLSNRVLVVDSASNFDAR